MAHLACKQLVTLFGLFAACDVEKNTKHDSLDDAYVGALAASRDPADLRAQDNTKVDFIGAGDGARGCEGGSYTVTVGGVDVSRQRFELYLAGAWQTPKLETALVHGEAVAVNVPRPHGHLRRVDRQPQMLRRPRRRADRSC